jgi:hypothetical protein
LLRHGACHLRVARADDAAAEQAQARPYGGTFTAAYQSTERRTDHRSRDGAAYAGLRSGIAGCAGKARGVSAAGGVIGLELVPRFPCARQRRD